MPLASTNYETGYFLPNLVPATFTYNKWDSGKTRGCVCDAEYGDVDCSKRMCQYGTDVMDQRQNMNNAGKYQVQHIHLQVENVNNVYDKANLAKKTFALTFKSKLNETFTTLPIVIETTPNQIHDFVLDVTNALQGLPNNVIDHVKVQAIMNTGTSANVFSFFDQTTNNGVSITCTAASTAITACDRTLYGVKIGTTVTATKPDGSAVTFGSGASSTTVATITGANGVTLAAAVQYSGQVILTFSGFQTAPVTLSISTSTEMSASSATLTVATAGISYGAVVSSAALSYSSSCTPASRSSGDVLYTVVTGKVVQVGMLVSGEGIVSGTTVTAVTDSTHIVISPYPLATAVVTLTFTLPPVTVTAVGATTLTLSRTMASTISSSTGITFTQPMESLASLGVAGAQQIGSDLLTSHNYIYMNITFDGNNVQGPQHPLMVKDILCGDGCTPKLTGLNLLPSTQNVTEIQLSDFNSYECGRRGKCDYTSGQCTCFSGYTGLSCNVITSLV